MDFSIFESLLALREQALDAVDNISAPHDKKSIELLRNIAQHRDRVVALASKAAPATIDEMFRAAAAPLTPPPATDPQTLEIAKALRANKSAAPKAARRTKAAKAKKKPVK
jgi:hypothetical protein